MLAQQRQQAILERVRSSGGVRVADLVRELGVSDMTIRRDLEVLAERGLVAKVHGGATAAGPGSTEEPGFAAKSVRQQPEKDGDRPARRPARPARHGHRALRRHHDLDARPPPGRRARADRDHQLDPGRRRLLPGPPADRTVVLTGGVRTPSDALVGPVAVAAIRRAARGHCCSSACTG